MTTAITFGTYTFPEPQSISDNFMDFVPSTDRIPGMDGGFDNYGWDTAPAQIGNVAISFILANDDTTTLQTLIDQFSQLAALGTKELRKYPHGASSTQFRYCLAKFNNVTNTEDLTDGFDQYVRRITVNFQVVVPVWQRRLANAAEWAYSGGADNLVWNSGTQYWDGMGATVNIAGYSAQLIVEYLGTAPSPLLVVLNTGAGQAIYNPRIQVHYDLTQPLFEVRWYGGISNGESLIIDSRRRQVILLSTTRPPNEEYGNLWVSSADWLQLLPNLAGSYNIQLYSERSTDAGVFRLSWTDNFYS